MTRSEAAAVIIPCYNQAHYLPDAVESALAQTYPEVEIVVVDDGSTDETGSVARRYPGVRLIRQDNRGLSAARNAGLAASSGSYCVFLDADDRLTPSAIEAGVDQLRRDDRYAFVSGFCTLIGPDGSRLFTPDQFLVESQHYRVLLRNNYIWNPASVVYRRAAVEGADGFDDSVPAAADYDLYLRVTRQWPVHCHGTVVAEYRQHGRNMSGDAGLMSSTITKVLQAQAEHVRGDPAAEADLAAGIEAYQLFYGDELLAEIRRHWSRRLPAIERRLGSSLEPPEREELVDEVRHLYSWLIQAFNLKRSSMEQQAHQRNLATREEWALREISELRQAVEGHLSYLAGLASTPDPGAGDRRAASLLAGVRDDLEYRVLVSGVRTAVARAVPEGATVLVVSHGDDGLLSLGGRQGWHFPHTDGGVHAGSHPADTEEALAGLDAQRAKGAGYLVLPRTELWWLTSYPGLEDGLDARGARIWEDDSCLIYRLGG